VIYHGHFKEKMDQQKKISNTKIKVHLHKDVEITEEAVAEA
jgi:hypothetical protein